MTNSDDDLGFGKKLDLSGFKPRPKESINEKAEERIMDSVAEKNGFTRREPFHRVQRVRKKNVEPQDFVYVRGSIDLINRFKIFCNDREITYSEAIELLLTQEK